MRRAETATAVGRDESPADVQMSRAFVAVVLGLALAFVLLRPVVDVPNLRTRLPELRAVGGIPSLVIKTVTGAF